MSVDDNVSWEDQLTYVQAGSWIAGQLARLIPIIRRPSLTRFPRSSSGRNESVLLRLATPDRP